MEPAEDTPDSLIEIIATSKSGKAAKYKLHIYRMSQNTALDYAETEVNEKARISGETSPKIKDYFEVSAADFDKYGKYNVKVRIKTESPKAKINFNYGGAPNDTFIGLTDRENDSIAGGVLVSVVIDKD